MERYSKDTIDKVGNAMIYLAQHVSYGISKTKMQKLLYILEECSVSGYKRPFFGITFEVWKFGPVFKDLHYDISFADNPEIFAEFIDLEAKGNGIFIKAKKDFNDDEFTDYDIEIMDFVISRLKDADADTLIKYTHRDGSPWDIAVKENNLDEIFASKTRSTSDVKIDFSNLLDKCDAKFYQHLLEGKEILESLK